jgi:hypothetical protein
MVRILSLVIGLGAVSFAAYWFLTHGQMAQQPDGRSGAAHTMDQMREKAHQIEVKQQENADRALQLGEAAEEN